MLNRQICRMCMCVQYIYVNGSKFLQRRTDPPISCNSVLTKKPTYSHQKWKQHIHVNKIPDYSNDFSVRNYRPEPSPIKSENTPTCILLCLISLAQTILDQVENRKFYTSGMKGFEYSMCACLQNQHQPLPPPPSSDRWGLFLNENLQTQKEG